MPYDSDIDVPQLSGLPLEAVLLDTNIVVFFGRERHWTLRIEQPCTVTLAGHQPAPTDFAPLERRGDPEGLDGLARLIGDVVERATAHRDGTLVIALQAGSELRVPPHDRWEAWTLTGPQYFLPATYPG